MLKSSFPLCDSDQMANSYVQPQCPNVAFYVFLTRCRYLSRHYSINKIQKRNNKLYIMEESSHTWLKYTCRMCKVCLFISFFVRLFHVQPTCPIWQKRHTFLLYHFHLHNVSKLTCYAARRNIVRNVMQLCILPGNFDPLNFVGVICKLSSVISLTETCIYIYRIEYIL